MNKPQIVPFSAMSACKYGILSAGHWNHYDKDGKCNCDRLCGYTSAFGGPCILPVDNHPKDARKGILRHDDGKRADQGGESWTRR